MVEAGELILKAFDRVLAVLKKMTLEHQGLLCMGRTHGIHAEPTSFSLKMAGFYAEFKRDRARFAAALDDMRAAFPPRTAGQFRKCCTASAISSELVTMR